jgi:hypothetical protein
VRAELARISAAPATGATGASASASAGTASASASSAAVKNNSTEIVRSDFVKMANSLKGSIKNKFMFDRVLAAVLRDKRQER